MRLATFTILSLVFASTLVPAQTKQKHPAKVPAVFGSARYVWVQALDGDAYDPSLYPPDRQAIADVEDAVQDWNRYALTAGPEDAELVILVRKGRVASGQTQVGVSRQSGPWGQTGMGVGVGGEVGPADDLLEVCMVQSDGTRSGPLWMRSLKDGLNAPTVELFRQFREAVEKDYPSKPGSKKSKP